MNDRIVSRGKIRVDARRALGKLREHLLVDLELYLSEIVRAATLGAAPELTLDWDSDDVIAGFAGETITPHALEHLLDHLTGDTGQRRLRLLALAVNAALGTGPEHVDVYVLDEGRSQRVRFRPTLFEALDARPERAQARPPSAAPSTGVVVHVRKRFGWNMMRRAIAGGAHREIELLSELLNDGSLPVLARGRRLENVGRARALLRRSFELHGARRAAVELVAAASSPSVEISELGVVLQRSTWPLGAGFPAQTTGNLAIPVRLVLDAPELPTNASRSAVREDARIVKDALVAAEAALLELVSALAKLVSGSEPTQSVELFTRDRAELEHALGTIVAAIAAEERRGGTLGPEARALLDLPLLTDATGGARPVSAFHREPRIWALSGSAAPAELAPWLSNVVWLRGKSAERALSATQLASADAIVELAKLGNERKQRLLAHPESEPSVPKSKLEIARRRFAFGELGGEVAVLTPDAPRSSVRVFLERRHFATLVVEKDVLPLPMDIAVGSPTFRPTFAFDAIEVDSKLLTAVGRALLTGIDCTLALGARLADPKSPEHAALALVLRCAQGTLLATAERFGMAGDAQAEAVREKLEQLRIWPTSAGRFATLAEIERNAKPKRAICYARPGVAASGVAADGRPVVVASAAELGWLAATLGGEIERVPYERALLGQERDPAQRNAALRSALDAVIAPSERFFEHAFELGRARGIAAVAPSSMVVELHAGISLGALPRPALFGDLVIAIDDPATVPKADWSGIHFRPARYWLKIESELLERVLSNVDPALLGHSTVRAYLLQTAERLRARIRQAGTTTPAHGDELQKRKQLLARLEQLPFVPLLEHGEQLRVVCLTELESIHPNDQALPVLPEPPDFDTFELRPVVLSSEAEQSALRKLFPRLISAASSLETLRKRALDYEARRAFEQAPELEPGEVPQADPAWPIVTIEQTHFGIESVSVGLPRPEIAQGTAIELLLWRRHLCVLDSASARISVAARVALKNESDVRELRAPSEAALGMIHAALEAGARKLANALVERAVEQGRSAALLADPRALALFHQLAQAGTAELTNLLQTVAWPCVQGDEALGAKLVAQDGTIQFGRQRYASWLGPVAGRSALDQPILHLPDGSPLQRVFGALGHRLVDVSAALAKLQTRRGSSQTAPPPRLSGEPAHPALRFTLGALGIARAEGELEIIAGPDSEVVLVELDGTAHPVRAVVPTPMRLVARGDAIGAEESDLAPLLRDATRAVRREIVRLADRFDELPPFVRLHARELVLSQLEKSAQLAKALTKLRVFEDIRGGHHCLNEIRSGEQRDWRFTELGPPYPERACERPILRLDAEAAKRLGQFVELRSATTEITRDREAERRRNAPPLETLALSPELRAKCLTVASFVQSSDQGEVGVLLPSAANERKIRLCVNRRPLTRIDDGLGWPLIALVNDDEIAPNRWFDAPQRAGDGKEITARVRRVGMLAVSDRWSALAQSQPSQPIDTKLKVSGARVHVLGRLWLPADVKSPRVRTHLPAPELLIEAPITTEAAIHPEASNALPISGELLVRVESGALPPTRHVLAALRPLACAAAAELSRAAHADLERWILVLCGCGCPDDLKAPIASGGSVSAGEIVAEIARSGRLWKTSAHSDADGAFPIDLPFVLALPNDSALVRALELVAPRLLAELVALPDPDPAEHDAFPKFDELVGDPKTIATPSSGSTLRRWLGRLREAVGLDDRKQALTDPLCLALFAALSGLELDGDPVTAIERRATSRLMSYEKRRRRLLIGLGDPQIVALAERATREPHVLDLIVAAAVSEVNRALTEVTDAEERRALLALLERPERPVR